MRVPVLVRLSSALVLLAALTPVPAAHAAEFDVEVADFSFAPDELFVNAGDTVTWTWTGAAPHNVTPVDPAAFEPSETQVAGTFEQTFAEEGQIPYFCTIHAAPDGSEGMIGTVTVLAEGEPLPEPAPEPRPAPEPGQLPAAADAVGTALAWSSLFADGAAPTAALGRDDVFADSLTSGAVQGLVDGPLLLTPPGDALDPRVVDELERLGTETVVIFGGTAAISQAIEDQLVASGLTVQRVDGPTRIETAVDAAATFFPDATSAFLVRSDGLPGGDPTQGFADSLSVGGAAAREGIPVLLSQTDRLSDSTQAYLQTSAITTVYVVGGVAALSEQVATDLAALQIEVVRLEGPTRFDTSLAVLLEFYGEPPVALLIDGQAPDAWVSGFAAASSAESAPIVLANGDDLPTGSLEGFSFGVQPLCGPGVSAVACERAQIASSAVQFGAPGLLVAVLSGDEEVPDPGAEGASGDLFLKPTAADDAICYEASAYGLDEAITGAHIHAGARGVAGDVVIPLAVPAGGFVASCAFDLDPVLVAEILANPSDYYANLHTETFPAGAVRGNLFNAEFGPIAELSPQNEVPPADIEGGGFAAFVVDADDHTRLGYYIGYGLADGSLPEAGHIHEAPEGENGPVVQELQLPTISDEEGAEGTFLLEGLDTAFVDDLLANSSDYYVNLHTEAFPDGALRGQLFNPFAGPPPGEGPPMAAFAGHRR